MSKIKSPEDKERNRQRKAEWYKENKEVQYARIKANQKKIKEWIYNYKKDKKCLRCKFDNPLALEFHHRDPSQKTVEISKIYYLKGWGLERIKQEIEKCDLICANCHRIEHLTNSIPSG